MSLKTNALITVDELLSSMQLTTREFLLDFVKIYNSSADASAATAVITSTGITLTVTGGANAHATTIAFAAQTTVGALITAIEALAKGWVITRLCASAQGSANFNATSVSCLLAANEKTLSGYNCSYLEDLINTASQAIEDYCRRVFVSATYTEYIDGNDSCWLRVKYYPVTTITSVQVWDAQEQAVDETLTEHEDFEFYLTEGMIYRFSKWSEGTKRYKVVYVAGYSAAAMPDSVKKACIKLCKIEYNRRGKEGIITEGAGGVNTTYDTKDVPNEVRVLIAPYVKKDL